SGWTTMDTIIGISGFNGTGSAGVIARHNANGTLHYYNATGSYGSSPPTPPAPSPPPPTSEPGGAPSPVPFLESGQNPRRDVHRLG
ncbi:MAG: hypothetical protein ACK5KU_09175, partial [Beutenbergiaceae bacterium]